MDYDAWKTGWWEDLYDQETNCPDCLEKEQKIDESHQYLDQIMKMCYGADKFDKEEFAYCLEHICWYLNFDFEPKGDLKLFSFNTKNSKNFQFLMNIPNKQLTKISLQA